MGKTPYLITDHETGDVFDWTYLVAVLESVCANEPVLCAKCRPGEREADISSTNKETKWIIECRTCGAWVDAPSEVEAMSLWAREQMHLIVTKQAWWFDQPRTTSGEEVTQ